MILLVMFAEETSYIYCSLNKELAVYALCWWRETYIMANKEEPSLRSPKKFNYSKFEEGVWKLYAGLEKLSRLDEYETDTTDDEILDGIEKDFKNFFKLKKENAAKVIKPKFRLLFDTDILNGTITDRHRAISLLQKQDESPINGDSILLRAMSINVDKESEQEKTLKTIIDVMVKNCPELIVFSKDNSGYMGITPVHLAILKEDDNLLNEMATVLGPIDKLRLPKEKIEDICAVGPVFKDTVMMAGTPLGVAALKFNKDIFCRVLGNFASGLDVTNVDTCDNIVHSLIKYACVQPDKIKDILEMLSFILNCKFIETNPAFNKKEKKWKLRKQSRKLLMMTNKEKLNPLQLAAKRQQFLIFELIMQTEVYHSRESGDGLFNEEAYDITEIETLELEEEGELDDEEQIKQGHHESIMEYIVHQKTSSAFLFVDFLPVKEVIKEKWFTYRRWFIGWFVIHVILMVLLSVAAVYRSKLVDSSQRNSTADFAYVVTGNRFVTVVSVIGLVFGLLYLAIEVARRLLLRFQFKTTTHAIKRSLRHFSTPYSNLIFRIYFCLFSLLLIVDCVVAATEASGSFTGYENYCLIFAVIIGWYLVMFFLQTFKTFSIFTVLIQKAVLDMLKFALVMTFFLVAFSVAMYMIMQGADTEDTDFNFFSTTLFKMLTIMLGIGDLDILFQARHPYLAIFVFVLFVLLTTILLLNALIAMMSNSCTDLMNNYGGEVAAALHCRLQKLSVILFLEGFFPLFICKEVGVKKKKHRYENNKWMPNIQRRLWARSSVHHHEGKGFEKSIDPWHTSYQSQAVFSLIKQLHSDFNDTYRSNKLYPSNTTDDEISSQETLGYSKSLEITKIKNRTVSET